MTEDRKYDFEALQATVKTQHFVVQELEKTVEENKKTIANLVSFTDILFIQSEEFGRDLYEKNFLKRENK